MISLKNCQHGFAYRIASRNLLVGVFNQADNGFVGIRTKFGCEYLFTEFHYDIGAPFGTVSPQEEIEKCPIDDLRESLGTMCLTCRQPVVWLEEEKWQHSEPSECEKIVPCDKTNQDLFDYLKKIEQKLNINVGG